MKKNIQIKIEGNRYLKISVGHEDAGYNYFSGNSSKKGIYVYFMEETLEDRGYGVISSMNLFDSNNFKIRMHEYSRKNQKIIESAFNYIEERQIELFDLYKNKDKESIRSIVQNFNPLYEKLQEKVKVKNQGKKEIVKI